MIKTSGRPGGTNNKVLMAFRFQPDLAKSIRRIAARKQLTQARLLEILVIRHGEDLVP